MQYGIVGALVLLYVSCNILHILKTKFLSVFFARKSKYLSRNIFELFKVEIYFKRPHVSSLIECKGWLALCRFKRYLSSIKSNTTWVIRSSETEDKLIDRTYNWFKSRPLQSTHAITIKSTRTSKPFTLLQQNKWLTTQQVSFANLS